MHILLNFSELQLFHILKISRGAWVAGSVKHPTLDLSSGLDLRVLSSGPCVGLHAGRAAYLREKKKSFSALILVSWLFVPCREPRAVL